MNKKKTLLVFALLSVLVPAISYAGTYTTDDIITKSPWADVRAFDANGDGITDDSTAIADAVATGLPVYFPAGTYLTDGFSAASEGQVFFGDGFGDSILLSNTGEATLTITSKDRCIVKDLYFKGGADHDNKVGTKGIEINTSARCQIHRCRFDYFSSHGIDFATASSGDGVHVISSCTFLHPVVGIHFVRFSGDSYVINCDIGHCSTAGIDCDSGTVRVVSNSIYDSAIGLDVTIGAGVELHRVVVLGNNFGDNNVGLSMDGSGGVLLDLCDISHNQFWNNTASNYKGMVLDTVKRSSFSNNNFTLYSDAAIDIDNSNTLIMNNFYFRTCSSHNVELDNSDNCILDNFMFDNPGAVAGNLYLLYKENAPARCQFTNWQVKTTNNNWYKVTNAGGSDNLYSEIQYENENSWDAGWYDTSDVIRELVDVDATSVIHTLKNDATPSIDGSDTAGQGPGNLWVTGGTTTITDLDDHYAGQEITILCKHSLTFDFTTAQDGDHNLDGSSADITADSGDILRFLSEDGTTLHLISNLDASADNN